jgi:alpha-glucosidase
MDPFDIAAWPGGAGRDGARSPMPWAAEDPNAGFSSAADTWLPLDPRHRALAVDRQDGDDNSALAFTRRLIALRQAHGALRLGAAEVVEAGERVLAFRRTLGAARLLCVFELAGRLAEFEVADARAEFAVSGGEALADGAVSLPAFGGAILRLGEA